MAENKVFMDTHVFTDIVTDIGGAASACVLPDEPLANVDFLDDSDVGKELHALLKEAYKMPPGLRAHFIFFKILESASCGMCNNDAQAQIPSNSTSYAISSNRIFNTGLPM